MVDIQIIYLNGYADKKLIRLFLQEAGISLNTFRYFKSRELHVLDNHIVTILFLENNTPICYGHLDPEEGKAWLGICVVESHLGKGYGKDMMKLLLKEATKKKIYRIDLAVDKINVGAINLYRKFGFKLYKNEKNIMYFYKHINDDCN